MKLVVHDASILIDLTLSEAVDAWFATGIETWTTDFIFPNEVKRPDQRARLEAYVAAGQLQIRATAGEADELNVMRLRLGRGLSLADVSALLLTQQFGTDAVLATGDGMLRRTAEREKIRACGILGLFDHMVTPPEGAARCALAPAVAAAKLQLLLDHPECRLPKAACLERIHRWKKT
jgi:hypothetical protein